MVYPPNGMLITDKRGELSISTLCLQSRNSYTEGNKLVKSKEYLLYDSIQIKLLKSKLISNDRANSDELGMRRRQREEGVPQRGGQKDVVVRFIDFIAMMISCQNLPNCILY